MGAPLGHTGCRVSFVAAHALFLWMYFAAEPLELMARGGLITGGTVTTDAIGIADEYAAKWRHGMAGNSWLYLPGFFATAAFTWLWSLRRSPRTLVAEGAVLIACAAVVAGVLAPFGTSRAILSFQSATGLEVSGTPPGFTAAGTALAVYTILTWDVGVMCAQLSLLRRSISLMWVPVVMNLALARVRPWTVGDFTHQWVTDVARGHPVAIFSALAIPALATALVLVTRFPRGPRLSGRNQMPGGHPCGPIPMR
jgi:hypothetical protein